MGNEVGNLKISFAQLSNLVSGEWIGNPVGNVEQLITDSRKEWTKEGGVFFAQTGNHTDGHNYCDEMYRKGTRQFVIEKSLPYYHPEAVYFKTSSTLKAMQLLVAIKRMHFNIPVVGITGSNGKTIVKEWLYELISEQYSVIKSPKSYNSQLGVALSVWGISDTHQVAIFEAGISQRDEMSRLAEMIKPTLGIFTNLGGAHDEGFTSREEKLNEKVKLFDTCNHVIYCEDYIEIHNTFQQLPKERITWSRKENLRNNTFIWKGEIFQLPFEDIASIENAIHAILAAKYLGIPNEQINAGLLRLPHYKIRFEIKNGIGNCTLIDDSYNNDPEGIAVALDFMSHHHNKSRKGVILSDFHQVNNSIIAFESINKLFMLHNIDFLIGIGIAMKQFEKSFSIPAYFYESTEDFLKQNFHFKEATVLVKGARKYRFERIVQMLSEKLHQTSLEINLDHIGHNLLVFKSLVSPNVKWMIMVKAFGYGGSSIEIARALVHKGVDYFAVAYADEGIELRENKIFTPIMVMNPTQNNWEWYLKYNLEPEIYSPVLLQNLINAISNPISIHIKLETGMNRLGWTESQLPILLKLLSENENIQVKSVFTHLSSADNTSENEFSLKQIELFEKMYQQIVQQLHYFPMRHVLNTSGIVAFPSYTFEMVRLGIGLYGYDPKHSISNKLRQTHVLKATISQIRNLKEGETIGYNRNGTAMKDMKMAVVSIGYADGYLRKFGNGKAYMTIHDQQAKTIGNICMDMTMIDISDIDANEGDEVIVFGNDPSLEQVAEWAQTIPYEILTSISPRVKRIFFSD